MRARHPVRTLIIAAGCILLLALIFFAPSVFFVDQGQAGLPGAPLSPQKWACPMLCVVVDAPGKCPVCGMDLEPIQSSGDMLVVGRTERELMGLTLAAVERRAISRTASFPGTVVEAEPSQAVVTAWVSGRIDDFPAPPTGSRIRAGQAVASIYSPDLIQAQQELLIAHSMAGSDEDGMLQAARRRLSQMGASQWLIDQIEEQDRVYSDVTVSSAYTGTVLERLVQDGDWVEKGQPILRIADLRTVWVQAELLEGQQGLLALGDTVMVSSPGSGAAAMHAVVEQIEPYLDPVTRSFSARVSVDNAQSSWLPGQLAMVETSVPETEPGSADGAVLSVPASSVLSLGARSVVYVEDIAASDAASDLPATTRGLVLRPRLVEVGPVAYDAAGDRYRTVISGLSEGEQVALQGAFLLDSQAELTGLESLLNEASSIDSSGTAPEAGTTAPPMDGMDMPGM